MKRYSDTSFLFSVYLRDIHSSTGLQVMRTLTEPVMITPIVEVELYNAIQLRVFRKDVSAPEAKAAAHNFEADIEAGIFSLQPLTPATFEIAKRLSARHTPTLGTRGFDLIHVASALALGADVFLGFDKNQRKLAQAAGLTLHPETI